MDQPERREPPHPKPPNPKVPAPEPPYPDSPHPAPPPRGPQPTQPEPDPRLWSPADAARALFEMYSPDIYRYALYVLGSPPEAEDVVQETFARVLRGWNRFAHQSAVRTWLWTIARRCVQDALRKRRLLRVRLNADTAWIDRVPADEHLGGMPPMDLDLQAAIARIRPSYRQVVVLRYIQDLSTDETARVLGWTTAKVRTTLHRALRALQRELLDPAASREPPAGAHGGRIPSPDATDPRRCSHESR
ncbi:RNA polymerase sigma factor [Alicyclobacillus macrosporangiidus]|uniref:RNA polymerase sigma factor n=1 Tax=Alicyclobacillus macrosporangiidus TaxID=392015 RepID=UPI0006923DC3|nr:sigma-70 family RNA polymerase sigma factor [Alicyclobacillus macrosporangiidus]